MELISVRELYTIIWEILQEGNTFFVGNIQRKCPDNVGALDQFSLLCALMVSEISLSL